MKKVAVALCFLSVLVGVLGISPSVAQNPQFPQTLPPNTLVGRTGINAGPAQAIPFSVLTSLLQLPVTCVSIVTFGGAGNNSNDNSLALTAALGSLGSKGGCIYFPAGTYKFNSGVSYSFLSGTYNVQLLGQGPNSSVLQFGATSGLTFTYAGTGNSVKIQDLAITTTAVNPSSTALTLTETTYTGIGADNIIENVEFRGSDGPFGSNFWGVDVSIVGVSNVIFNYDSFWGPTSIGGIGINLFSSSFLGIVYNVNNCYFEQHQYGIEYGSNMQGLTVSQSNFNQDGEGIFVPASQTNLSQLGVFNSQFNAIFNDIEVQSYVPYTSIVGNMFLVDQSGGTGYAGILLNLNAGYQITGNSFSRNNSLNGQQGVVIGSTCSSCGVVTGLGTISANTFTGLAFGVSMLSGALNTTVANNAYTSNTTNVSNVSTSLTNNGSDLPQVAFTPGPVCQTGSGTWTTTSAGVKQNGKLIFISMDMTLTSVGTCSGSLFNLSIPITAGVAGGFAGEEITVTANGVNCSIRAANLNLAVCSYNGTLASNDRFVISGTYATQ